MGGNLVASLAARAAPERGVLCAGRAGVVRSGGRVGVTPVRPGRDHVAGLACGSISRMSELADVPGAFGYGDSILAGVRDDDLPVLAEWEMDPGRMATLSSRVAPPSEAAAKERIAKWSANDKEALGFAIETLGDPPPSVLAGRAQNG